MKKPITKLLVLLSLVLVINTNAQNPRLTLPNQFYQSGQPGTTSLPLSPAGSGGYNGISSYAPHNMYANAQGQSLVFEANGSLYNKNGFLIADLKFDVNSLALSQAESIIVPDPGNCSRFYYIGSGLQDGVGKYFPVFSLIDMSQPTPGAPIGETGKVLTTNSTGGNVKNLFDSDITPDYGVTVPRPILGNVFIAVTKPRVNDGNSRLLFVYNAYMIYIYKITATGIQFYQMDSFSTLTNGNYTGTFNTINGELEIYEDTANNKIKMAIPAATPSASNASSYNMVFLDFNTSTNTYSNYRNFCISGLPCVPSNTAGESYKTINGIEFSQNGNYVYFTHDQILNNGVYAEWIEYNNITNRHAISPSGVTMSDFKYSQIELGLDGKMYFATSNRLAAISNSNSPTTTITYPYNSAVYSWNNSAVTLSSYPLISSFISPGPTVYYYALPDQVDQDTYGGFYSNSTACCYLYTPFEIEKDFYFPTGTTTVGPTFPVNVTGTDSYNNPMTVTFNSTTRTKGNVFIKPGANVTFNNLRLEFVPISTNSSGAKLVVNRFTSATGGQGGKLTTNASTLTVYGGCENNKMWPGVEILGYNQSGIGNQGSFANSVQGRVKLNTGSVIEHAVTGLSLGTGVGNDGGGVVEGLTCTIQNCQRGLRMYPATYITSNQTVFNNSTFRINQILNDNVNYPPYAMVDVTDIKALKFYGCTFQDVNLSYNRTVHGIVCNSTQLIVDRYLASDTYKSKFINLNHGIWAQSTIPSRAITCNKAEFTTNLVGAFLTTINVSAFTNNIFKMVDNLPSNQFSVGLAMYVCDAYNISDNRFQNNTVSVASNATIGCKIEESNPSNLNGANLVFRNTFENLHFGCQAAGNNAVPNDQLTNDIGLKFYCNTFSGTITWANIAVTSGKIDYHQGFVDYAAENKFSHTAVGSDYLQHSGVPNIEYNWKQNTVLNITKPTINVSSSVFVTERTTHNNTCTTQGGGGSQRLVNQTSNNVLSNIETKRALLITSKSKGTTNASVAKSTDEDSQIRTEIDMLYQEVIREYANDTINPNAHDSAMVWIDRYLKEKEVSGALLRNKLEQNREKESGTIYNSLLNAMGYNNNTRMHEILKYLDNKDIRTTLLTEPVLLNDVLKIAEDTLSDESFLLSQSVLANLNVMHPHHNYEGFDLSGASMKVSNIQESISSVYKLSNFPNPFTGKTTLTAFVPKGSNDASIVITDVLGKEVAKYTLIEGNNAVQFDKQEVKGILYYSLFIDGARKETKMMMKQ